MRVRSRNAAMTTVTFSSYVNVRVRSMPPRDAECDASSRKERRDIGRGPLRQRDEMSAPGRSTSRVRLDTERGEAPRGPSQRREGWRTTSGRPPRLARARRPVCRRAWTLGPLNREVPGWHGTWIRKVRPFPPALDPPP